MKDFFTIIFTTIVSNLVSSQVIIGDQIGTVPAASKTSVLLEFANTNNKGIVLPYVRQKSTTPTEGSIILDATDATKARIKFYNANTETGTEGWKDLSGQDANITTALANQPTIVQVPEAANAMTIIGSNETSVKDGVLVLESTSKALVLPQVTDVNNIKNPAPGMMVYVNKSGAKRLAVFNGSKWSFWKP